MSGATDEQLRRLARRLAGRVALRLTRTGRLRERGVGRLRRVPLEPGGDLDLDASLDPLLAAAAGRRAPAAEDLRATVWARPSVALCLLVDRSGSVGGQRLATAALAAAAVSLRAPDDHSVIAFNDRAVVLRAQAENRPVLEVVQALLALRGHGTTDLALAFEAARRQLAPSRASRRITVLLSDARPTAGPDPVPAARGLDELLVLAPAGDAAQARAFAATVGARLDVLAGPSDVPRALRLLSD
jgi:Mg-chelatase subunit ChlD